MEMALKHSNCEADTYLISNIWHISKTGTFLFAWVVIRDLSQKYLPFAISHFPVTACSVPSVLSNPLSLLLCTPDLALHRQNPATCYVQGWGAHCPFHFKKVSECHLLES